MSRQPVRTALAWRQPTRDMGRAAGRAQGLFVQIRKERMTRLEFKILKDG